MKYNFLRFPGGKAKAVTFSYDDGSKDDVRFLDVINKYNLKCTFNLVGELVENEAGLSKDFIKENILSKGHEIAVHGYCHRGQNKIRSIEGIRDILDCRILLEREFGIIVRGMAFPDTAVNRFQEPEAYKRVKKYIEDLDIAYVRSGGGDNDKFKLPEEWHNWMPTVHHDNPRIFEYMEKFINLDVSKLYISMRTPKLFYVWGHSFEFERNQNWEHLDEICQKISGKDDIWYATNMEIYEYVQAYNSLVYSADGTIVYNPTLFDIWFDIDGTMYFIKSGETITLSL